MLVLEKNARVGEKIAISGGGRCNFTNVYTAPDHFLSENPDFCRSALARFTPQDFIARVERHGVDYHEKTLGQLFCDGSSRQIIEMLLSDCVEAGVELWLACEVTDVARGATFRVSTDRGVVAASSLVLATGGLSIPKLGASDFAYRAARRFGLKVVPPRPALVPLTISAERLAKLRDLAGVSFPATVRCNGAEFRESALFTHRGLSGPAILQISSYWRPNDVLSIDVLPGTRAVDVLAARRARSAELATVLAEHLPRRMAQAWCALEAPSRPMNEYSDRELDAVAARLHDWRLEPSGTEGFAKAEVTAGGVDTTELSSKTMEAKGVPGLFCIGEAVDVTGHLGGFNFQWAWASAWAAGQHA